MPKTSQIHITNAYIHLQKSVCGIVKKINSGQILSTKDAQLLSELSDAIQKLKRCMIIDELQSGLTGVQVAKRYGLSPGRVSQIYTEFKNGT